MADMGSGESSGGGRGESCLEMELSSAVTQPDAQSLNPREGWGGGERCPLHGYADEGTLSPPVHRDLSCAGTWRLAGAKVGCCLNC